MMLDELIAKYCHESQEFPILAKQTHKIIRDRKMVNERININENLIHYLKDTALLISVIAGSVPANAKGLSEVYDHVVYLDKSARPVSWLVNMFWDEFAGVDNDGIIPRRPKHSYINIDRSPWFRNVGINVSDDGRQKANGELATYKDFMDHISNLTDRHLAEIRALYIDGGIEKEDFEWIMNSPTILDGKRILVIDEVSRTGSTLNIATHLFKLAFPKAERVDGTYFWHPDEPALMLGDENVLTSLPVWYDPHTLIGRGIGGLDVNYYRKRYEYYERQAADNPKIDVRKLRTQAFSASVFSAPLLKEDGTVLSLQEEKKTLELTTDLLNLYRQYKAGRIFFEPPIKWLDFIPDCFMDALEKQGVKLIPEDANSSEMEAIRKDPLFYLNFVRALKTS